MNGRHSMLPAAALACLLFASCKYPLSEQILRHVEDSIAPEISITSPKDGSSYASAVWVEGTARDSSRAAGDNQGSIISMSYQVLATSLGGNVSVQDGRFSFVFSTVSLAGNNITILIRAVDWNENVAEAYLGLVYRENDIPSFAAVSGNRSITLSWDPIPGAESYTLYYTKDGSYPNLPDGTNGSAVSDVQPGFVLNTYIGSPMPTDRVKNGRRHVFRLRAAFPAALGMKDSWSDYVQSIPLSPLTLAPKVSKDLFGQVELWWHDIPAEVGYLVYRAESKAGPYYQLTGALAQAQYTDRNVSDGTTYWYKVKPERFSAVESYPMPGKTTVLEFSPKKGGLVLGTKFPGAVLVSGARAYLGTTLDGFNILDVTDPSQPSRIGYLDFIADSAISGIALKGDYAYLASHQDQVQVVGINPANPDYLQTKTELVPQGAHEAVVYGNELYCTSYSELYLYDVTNAGSPSFKKTFSLWALSYNNQMFLEPRGGNRRAYICGGYTDSMGLDIIDIINPATPTFTRVATYYMDVPANQVQVEGNYAYIASNDGIRVVDVSNPPTSLSNSFTVASSQKVVDLVIIENTLYALVVNKGLYRYRIPDLAHPEGMVLERIYEQIVDGRFFIQGDYAYVSNPYEGSGGLSVIYVGDELFDLSDRPVFTFSDYGSYDSVTDLDMYGDLCFATILRQGLEILRLTPPASLQSLGSFKTGTTLSPLGVKVVGEMAFLAEGSYGLHILDVSKPSAPVRLGGLAAIHCGRVTEALTFCQLGLEVIGDYLFLPGFDGGILVADVSDPANPEKLTVIPMISDTIEVTAQGPVLYAAAYSSGLFAYDITEPEDPRLLSRYYEGGSAMGLDVEGSTVYLAAFDRAVDIIDYSNPAQPLRRGRYDWPDPLNWGWLVVATDVDVVRNYAYVSRFEASILVLDVSDPRYPFPQGRWRYSGDPYQRKTSTLAVLDDYVHAVGIESNGSKPAWMMYHLQTQ